MKEITTPLAKSGQVIYQGGRVFSKAHDPFCLRERERRGRPPAAGSITKEPIWEALKTEPRQAGYRGNARRVKTPAEELNKRYH